MSFPDPNDVIILAEFPFVTIPLTVIPPPEFWRWASELLVANTWPFPEKKPYLFSVDSGYNTKVSDVGGDPNQAAHNSVVWIKYCPCVAVPPYETVSPTASVAVYTDVKDVTFESPVDVYNIWAVAILCDKLVIQNVLVCLSILAAQL